MFDRCAVRQQSHRVRHRELQQRLTECEARLAECAATPVTSSDECSAQQRTAAVCEITNPLPVRVRFALKENV